MTKAEAWDEIFKLIWEKRGDTPGDIERKLRRIEARAHGLAIRLEYEPDPEEDDRR